VLVQHICESGSSRNVKAAIIDAVVLSFSRSSTLPLPSLITFLLSVARCTDVLPTVCRSLRISTPFGTGWMLEVIAPQLQAFAQKKANSEMVLQIINSCLPFQQMSPSLSSLLETLTPAVGEFFLDHFPEAEKTQLVLSLFVHVPLALVQFLGFVKQSSGDIRLMPALLVLVRSPALRSQLLMCRDAMLSILQQNEAGRTLAPASHLALVKSELFVMYS